MSADAVVLLGGLVTGLGLILQIVSVVTTYWMTYSDAENPWTHTVHFGLFDHCSIDGCRKYSDSVTNINFDDHDLRTVQGLICAGVAMSVVSCILLTVAVILKCMQQFTKVRVLLGLSAAIPAVLSGVLSATGAGIFGTEVYSISFLGNFFLLHTGVLSATGAGISFLGNYFWLHTGNYGKYFWLHTDLDFSFGVSIAGSSLTSTGGILAAIGSYSLALAGNTTNVRMVYAPGSLPATTVVYGVTASRGNVQLPVGQANQPMGMQPHSAPMANPVPSSILP